MTVFHRGTHKEYVAFMLKHRASVTKVVVAHDRVILYHEPLEEPEGGVVFVQGVFPCST